MAAGKSLARPLCTVGRQFEVIIRSQGQDLGNCHAWRCQIWFTARRECAE